MSIIDNINKQLKFDKDGIYPGGKEIIKQIVEKAPIQLPADYYEFLSCISGTGNIGSIEFEIESDDEDIGSIPICLWSANRALGMQNEFAHPMKENFISKVWFIGDDLGDMVYFYGFGNDGFGVYFVEAGSLGIEYAYKIADTLTDFLVNGIGIDVNLLEYAVLEEKAAAATAHHNELSARIKAAEKRMAEIAVLRTHIINYAKTRETYVAYRKAGYSKKFRQEHEEEILLHQAAKNAFDDKKGCVPSALTQNVKDLLASREIEAILDNTDFMVLLAQAQSDRAILAKQLGISEHQLSYITHSNPGEGLLFYGSTTIPFVDRFPKGEIYNLLTTRPEDLKNEPGA